MAGPRPRLAGTPFADDWLGCLRNFGVIAMSLVLPRHLNGGWTTPTMSPSDRRRRPKNIGFVSKLALCGGRNMTITKKLVKQANITSIPVTRKARLVQVTGVS